MGYLSQGYSMIVVILAQDCEAFVRACEVCNVRHVITHGVKLIYLLVLFRYLVQNYGNEIGCVLKFCTSK